MLSKLYIASKPALHDQLNPQHLYIVYDPDGNPNSGDELIIRGGPPAQTTGFSGFISVEIARPILLSLDGPVSGDDPPYTINDLPSVESRNFTLIEEGTAADALWATMVDFAISLSNDEDAQAGGVYGTDFTYAPTNSNSNSTVASVLAGAGLNVNDYLPVIGGDLTGTASPTAPRYDFNDVPGAHVLLSGGESNTFSGFGRGPATQDNVFFDTADADGDSGNDVFYGGALNNKVAKNNGDGKDAYFYIQPGPSERLTLSDIRDGSGNHIGHKVETPDGKYDELYSIEIIGNRTYDNTHAIMYQFNAGLQIRDLSATELAGLSGDFDAEFVFETALEVDFGGGITTQFANFGDITATEHNDVFQVSAAIGRSFDGGGGSDTVLFTEVSDGISVTASSASNLVVAKGIAGAQGTDHLYSVEAIWGSTGNDTFNGVKGGSLYYRGQDGSDDYVFDLAADTGSVLIYDNGSTGIDTLRLTNFGEDMLISKDQVEEDAVIISQKQSDPEEQPIPFLALRDLRDIDNVELNGALMRTDEFLYLVEQEMDGELLPYPSLIYDLIYGDGGPNNAGGGVSPEYDGGGALASLQVRPDITGRYMDYAYSSEYLHPFIITDYVGGPGGCTMTFDSYLQSIQMVDGISVEDVRFTVNSSSGNANLTIHIDALGESHTIQYYESGKTLSGIALYDSALHSWAQGIGGSLQGNGGPGQYTGTYTQEYTLSSGLVQVTYFLEAMHFGNDPSINLQGTMTFTGTSDGETLYGLDTRGDIIKGLAGDDHLYSYGGDDTLIGGTGRDVAAGGQGDDTYIFEVGFGGSPGGPDVVNESLGEGTDTIHFGGGITAEDVYGWTDSYGRLYLQLAGSPGDILYINASGTSNNSTDVNERVERVTFDDQTVWDWTQGLILNDSDEGHYLYATDANDVLSGNGGNDDIKGFAGNDTINGGAGRDLMYGGTGDDIYVFEAGFGGSSPDIVYEELNEGTDTIHFGGGITPEDVLGWTDVSGNVYLQLAGSPGDRLYINGSGSSANSTDVNERVERVTFDDETVWDLTQGLILNDSDEDHDLYASDANDTLHGNGGNDNIKGFAGNDTINGGAGRDLMYGGTGDDIYVFEAGFGGSSPDIVYEELNEGTDTIHFGGGITAEDVYGWTDSYGRLYLQLAGSPGDILYINASGTSNNSTDVNERVERVTFDDQTVWDWTQGLILNDSDEDHDLYASDANDTLHGNGGNDNIKGFAGNDTINGGAGRDIMYGGTGDDTYVFEAGFGGSSPDIIYEELGEGTDTIHFGGGITAEDVYGWTDSYGRLYLQLAGSPGDILYINATGASNNSSDVNERVERVTFDDQTVWDWTQGLILNDSDEGHYLYATDANDVLSGNGGNDDIKGFAGNDTINGGAGRDIMYGGTGDDTYVFEAGFGGSSPDIIYEELGEGTDTIHFGGGITAEDVYGWTDSYGRLYLQLEGASADTLYIDGVYSSSTGVDIGSYVEYVSFDDATTWDLTQGLHLRNNDTARTLYGSAENDIIEGGAANDTLRGFDGDDWLAGHGGTDALWGYDGADTSAFMLEDVGNGIDTLRDFDMTENDVIDLRDVLDGGYDPMTDALADFVKFTNSGSHAALSVDLDGAGTTYGWTQIATVYNHTNLDADVLATNGHLLAA